jgi:hypothetical protein
MIRRWSASLLSLFIFCLICPFLFSTGWAAEKGTVDNELLVIGSGTVTAGNIAAARQDAIAHAMSKALEDYLATRLGEANMITSFERLVREILPAAKDGIENFHILAKDLDANRYRVLVKVKINSEVIEERLKLNGITTVQLPNIRILFMVSEVKGDSLTYWWKGPETFSQMAQTDVILYRVFQEHGFIPVDRTLGALDIAYSKGMTSPDLKVPDLLQWGRLLSADVVIAGRTVFLDESRVYMALKAFSVKEGLALGEAAETGQRNLEKDSNTPAELLLERVARILVRRLGPSIIQETSAKPAGIQLFQVQLRGLRSLRQYRDLLEFLRKEVSGVQSVMESRIEGGTVTVTVAFLGEREKLLSGILNKEGIPAKMVLEKSQDNEIVLSGSSG